MNEPQNAIRIMQTKPENVRGDVPLKILWKWTGVSTVIHGLLIAVLCGFSYWGQHKKDVASKAKIAVEEAALKKKEAEEAAKATNAPPAVAVKVAVPVPAPAGTNQQAQAEKTLGIDKVAKPNELPKSPFSSKNDDLLKDLK